MNNISGESSLSEENPGRRKGVEEALFLLLGASLNITFTFSGMGSPLRMGASDFLLPVLAGCGLWALLRQRWHFRLQARTFVWACIACSVWIMVSLAVGRMHIGEWTSWAICNRGVGWYVVLAYFFVGAYAVQKKKRYDLFISGLIWTSLGVSLVSCSVYYMNNVGILGINTAYRNSGLLMNPNAFGILTAVCFFVYSTSNHVLRGNRKFDFFACLLFAFAGLTSFSRTGWVLFLLVFAGIFLLGIMSIRRIIHIVVFVLIFHISVVFGSKLIGGMFDDEKRVSKYNAISAFGYDINNAISAHNRFELFQASLRSWRDAPVMGTGIGVVYAKEVELRGPQQGSTLHSTPLWLLVETGLVGFALFSWLYFASLWRLWRNWRHGKERRHLLGFGTLLLLGLASLPTDVMFQRYLWTIWGIALAVPCSTACSGLDDPGGAKPPG